MDALERNPRAVGQRHPAYEGVEMWIYQSPPVARVPRFYVLYEIDGAKGEVILWNFRRA